jgi:outer membrane protein OmpA-like peptidoglycan-associated protein
MQSDRVANFAKISNVTGKTNLIKLPHDAGTKITLTDGVATSLKDRLKLETTSEGLNITAVNGWTGRISVPAVVTQSGEQVELFVAVVEVPAPVLFPKFYLDDLLSATIKWQPDGSQVVFYNVYLGNQLLCTTPSTMCTQVGQLNTKADLHIEAVGHQSTFSTQVPPVYTSTALIPATVVHFDTASAKLGSYEQSLLDDLVLAAKNMGLNTIYITGHTDSTGNPALNIPLSKARSTAVKKYIEKFFPKVTIIWRGFAANNPVATNSTTSGRENNRRAEVSVG